MRSGCNSARLSADLIITSVSECDRWNLRGTTACETPLRFPHEEWGAPTEDGFSQLFLCRLVSTSDGDWSVSGRFCEFRRPIREFVRALLTRHGTLGERKSPRTAETFPSSLSWMTSVDFGTGSLAEAGVFSLSSITGEKRSPERCLKRGDFPETIVGDFVSPRNSASSSFSRFTKFPLCISNELWMHNKTTCYCLSCYLAKKLSKCYWSRNQLTKRQFCSECVLR